MFKIVHKHKPIHITYTNKYTGETVKAYGVDNGFNTIFIADRSYFITVGGDELVSHATNRVCGLNPKITELEV